jgi:hypothetical protein
MVRVYYGRVVLVAIISGSLTQNNSSSLLSLKLKADFAKINEM